MKKTILLLLMLISLSSNSQLLTIPQFDFNQPIYGGREQFFSRNADIDNFYFLDSVIDVGDMNDIYKFKLFPKDSLRWKASQITGLKAFTDSQGYLKNENFSNVQNLDQTNPSNIVQNSTHRFVSDSDKANWNNKLSVEADGSITNEIQGLTLSGNLLGITGGNSVTLPTYTNVNLTAGNGILITGTYPNLTISLLPPSVNVVSRSLNSNFTVSTTKTAHVSYSVTCSATNPLLAGSSTATAYLEYSLNGGTTWLLPSQNGNSNSVGAVVAIALNNSQTGTLTSTIPANALVRIRTSTSGTASVTYVTGTESTY